MMTALDALEAANAETDVSDSDALMPDSDGITEADMKSDSEWAPVNMPRLVLRVWGCLRPSSAVALDGQWSTIDEWHTTSAYQNAGMCNLISGAIFLDVPLTIS